MFVDGSDVATWFDLHTSSAAPCPTVNWSRHIPQRGPSMVYGTAEKEAQMGHHARAYAFAAALGLLAAFAAAIAWAAISVATGMRIGYMSIGAAFAIAFVVRHSVDRTGDSTGVLSAMLALAGCALGNFLTACVFASRSMNVPLSDVVVQLLPRCGEVLAHSFRPMDIAYYTIAVYAGYRYGCMPMRKAPSTT